MSKKKGLFAVCLILAVAILGASAHASHTNKVTYILEEMAKITQLIDMRLNAWITTGGGFPGEVSMTVITPSSSDEKTINASVPALENKDPISALFDSIKTPNDLREKCYPLGALFGLVTSLNYIRSALIPYFHCMHNDVEILGGNYVQNESYETLVVAIMELDRLSRDLDLLCRSPEPVLNVFGLKYRNKAERALREAQNELIPEIKESLKLLTEELAKDPLTLSNPERCSQY